MGVLEFDGFNDELVWSTLDATLGEVSDGAWTVCVVIKRGHSGNFYEGLSCLGDNQATISFMGGGGGAIQDSIYSDLGTATNTTTTFTNTTDPYMFVLSKGAGSVAPRLAWKLGSGGSWSHENLDVAVADRSASAALEIGAGAAAGEFFLGHIGIVAWWEGAMSDANKEALDNNWQTSDLWDSAHGQPAFLAELNIAAVDVFDMAANASNFSVVGAPTLDSGETLDSWNFNGDGTVFQAMRPSADVTTTGWTSTPLWSKIEEETADGTVITATAS